MGERVEIAGELLENKSMEGQFSVLFIAKRLVPPCECAQCSVQLYWPTKYVPALLAH